MGRAVTRSICQASVPKTHFAEFRFRRDESWPPAAKWMASARIWPLTSTNTGDHDVLDGGPGMTMRVALFSALA